MTDRRTQIFVGTVAVAAAAVFVAVYSRSSVAELYAIRSAAFFAVVGALGHAMAYKLPKGGFGAISFIPFLAAVAVAPAYPAVVGVAVAVLIGELAQRRERIKSFFNVSWNSLAVGTAVLVYLEAGGTPLAATGLDNLIPFAAGFAAFFIVNILCFSAVIAISTHQKFIVVLTRSSGSLIYDACAIPFVYGFAYVFVRLGWTWTAVLVLPLFGLRQLYKTNWQLQMINEELLQLMVAAIEARDPYTSGHSQRVANYTAIVCQAAGLTQRATERVYAAALLHDVGKIHEEFAPILRKPGRLTDEEFAIMKSHSVKGAALVAKVSQFEDLVSAVWSHHEAWDGTGYPDGIKGEAIPQWARVIAVADTIDAMTTDRPYREALTPESVREELVRQAGRQFDPEIARALAADGLWPEMLVAIRESHTSTDRFDVPAQQAIPQHSIEHARPITT